MIRATSEAEAEDKARRFGEAAEMAYENAEGMQVTWRFKEVLDVKRLFEEDIGDGS